MKHVLITGGSRGIGAAAVAAFAARGDDVTFLYHRNHEAAQTVARRTGATPLCCDVANGDAVAVWPRSCSRRRFSLTTGRNLPHRPDLPDHAPAVAAAL